MIDPGFTMNPFVEFFSCFLSFIRFLEHLG